MGWAGTGEQIQNTGATTGSTCLLGRRMKGGFYGVGDVKEKISAFVQKENGVVFA